MIKRFTYYQWLGVSPTAPQTEIERAYRWLSTYFYTETGDTEASRFALREINKAYETLSDPEKRRRYDASHRFSKTTMETTQTRGDKESEILADTVRFINRHIPLEEFILVYRSFKRLQNASLMTQSDDPLERAKGFLNASKESVYVQRIGREYGVNLVILRQFASTFTYVERIARRRNMRLEDLVHLL